MGKRQLPKPSKGRDLSIEDKIRMAEEVCKLYATDQYTIKECLRSVGIKSESTWALWRKDIEEIEELYLKAKHEKEQRYNEGLVERALTSLERAVEGFHIDAIEQEGTVTPDGNFIVSKVKKKQIYVKPSVGAITYVLNNLKRGTFTRNPAPDPTNDEKPDKLEIEIKGGSLPPITDEDDILDITK